MLDSHSTCALPYPSVLAIYFILNCSEEIVIKVDRNLLLDCNKTDLKILQSEIFLGDHAPADIPSWHVDETHEIAIPPPGASTS